MRISSIILLLKKKSGLNKLQHWMSSWICCCVAPALVLLVFLWGAGQVYGSVPDRDGQGQGQSMCLYEQTPVMCSSEKKHLFNFLHKDMSILTKTKLPPCPVGFPEPAFLGVLLSLCGDAGHHDDASYHTEIQRQPGRHSKRQSQPRCLRQGERSKPWRRDWLSTDAEKK